jgi:hypothetical protein
MSGFARTVRLALAAYPMAHGSVATLLAIVTAVFYRGSRQDVYNLLWVVVFGFATLNIIGLAARRMEPSKRGMSFGEILAVMVVLIAIFLLGWEMLNMFHIFPIRLRR